jgi:CO/xanthine dehydrogenase Mo-binding subunit
VAAWVTGRPVRAVWSRPESMASSTKRHPSRIVARAGCDAEGRLVALDFEGVYDTGAYASWGPTVAGRVPVHASGPYRVPHLRARARAVFTHQPPSGAFRGFGVPQAAIAQEALWDRLADACGLDRLEFRIRNALVAGDRTATGQVLEHSAGQRPASRRCGRAGWSCGPRRRRATRRAACCATASAWPACGTASATPACRTLRDADRARHRRAAHFLNGAVDIGQGSDTVLAQIAAEALGLPVAALVQVNGDTARTPDAGKTSASRQTFVSGRARWRRRWTCARRSGRAQRRARLGRRADGERRGFRPSAPIEGVGRFDPPTVPLDANGQGVPYATYGFAAQLCALSVDVRLGSVKLGNSWRRTMSAARSTPPWWKGRSMVASPRGSGSR